MIKRRIQIRGRRYTFFLLEGEKDHAEWLAKYGEFHLRSPIIDENSDYFMNAYASDVTYLILERKKIIAIRHEEWLSNLKEINSLCTIVHQNYRNRGIASRLFEETFKNAIKKKYRNIEFTFASKKAYKLIEKINQKYPTIQVISNINYSS